MYSGSNLLPCLRNRGNGCYWHGLQLDVAIEINPILIIIWPPRLHCLEVKIIASFAVFAENICSRRLTLFLCHVYIWIFPIPPEIRALHLNRHGIWITAAFPSVLQIPFEAWKTFSQWSLDIGSWPFSNGGLFLWDQLIAWEHNYLSVSHPNFTPSYIFKFDATRPK